MKSNNAGYSLVEVLVALAIATLTINFYLIFANDSTSAASNSKNYLQAVSIMNNLYQDIVTSSSANWAVNATYTIYLKNDGSESYDDTTNFFVVTIRPTVNALLDNFKEITSEINWSENGQSKTINFRVIK